MRVLLADDDPAVRTTARRFLERAGFGVVEARGGREALAAWDAASGGIDALVTDAVMPDVGGHALAAALRARRPHLPVVVMSGYSAEYHPGIDATPQGATAHGAAWMFVGKPFSGRELVAAVQAALHAAPDLTDGT